MGLHICYELRLPGDVIAEDAGSRLEALRDHALTVGADYVSPIRWLTAIDLAADPKAMRPWSFERTVHFHAHEHWEDRGGTAAALRDWDGWIAAAFLMNPGKGCESAYFGLVRPIVGERSPDAERAEEASNWFWHDCCKTQYASRVSDEHLVRCHLAVVQTLEAAERLGIGITVRDETRYWETRSTEVLLSEVRRMNQIVARIAGAFHDAAPGVVLESPIFGHPDFERLESEAPRISE